MAELLSQDVEVNQQSGGRTPSDVPAPTSQTQSIQGDEGEFVVDQEKGSPVSGQDDQAYEDATTRSETSTSRADGSNADAKSTDARPLKKAVAAKPVSFAKYSVPKVIAASTGKTSTEKTPTSTSSTLSQAQTSGRPRLVAKTTSALSQKVKPFRAAAPDPMQVWNKNRVTPQPSTKNLTDEELKQQYGIHLTQRLQSDGEGKEAKWADIDDDEDDWAPETIEWGDGTKTTVNAADATPAVASAATSKPTTPAIETPAALPEPKPSTSFSTSIGPNATVLKIGARAENQQAQKAAQQSKGPVEKSPVPTSKTTPAPVPAKSPWAVLPPVEKIIPVDINPQHPQSAQGQYLLNGSQDARASAPTREISADDFNRSRRDSVQPQLFMPNSGRYESVPENRRRASRNDQGFRAPAVLQRPGQTDMHAPEPSPAFQTNRTSSDVMRRRASSTVSGDSGQIARRMSIKSGELQNSMNAPVIEDTPELQSAKLQPTTNPAYQARGGDYVSVQGQTDAELEAQRAQQRRLMREQAELARKRRLEEEERQEAEKKERIRQKLLALGPDPKVLKAEQEAKAKAEAEINAREQAEKTQKEVPETKKEQPASEASIVSPPKPPQPTATGEPQQYGMMKVHPMDTVKKSAVHIPAHLASQRPTANIQNASSPTEEISPEPPVANGIRTDAESNRFLPENGPVPEPIPRNNRPVSATSEARVGWGRNDHRAAPPANLWGAPHNKALGNGTFDQTLAGYAPQDLSSRASSTGQGWMNGKTPTVGQSPQLGQTNQHVPETRSQTLQNMTSPEPLPLAMNSEADSMLPVRPPAPIGPPQVQHSAPLSQNHAVVNGHGPHHPNAAVAGWHNFQHVARAQDRADLEQQQRESAAKREEEKRSGTRQQAGYNFEETFKQVQLGQQPDQRHVHAVAQSTMAPPPSMFGAVGSVPPSTLGHQTGRGSRFFPPQTHMNGVQSPQSARAVMFEPVEVSRSPSPPPAEELLGSHPVYEGDALRPIIKFPREKAIVKLPPAKPPTPPAPAPAPQATSAPAVATTQSEPAMPIQSSQSAQPTQPMTWAARVSMPAPKPMTAPIRGGQQPIVQNPSWQERFNGLLGNGNRKTSDTSQVMQGIQGTRSAGSAFAVTSATKEPLDGAHTGSALVSLPGHKLPISEPDTISSFTTKDVEDEEDLFEDREPGSLPSITLPTEAPAIKWPRPVGLLAVSYPPESQSANIILGSSWKDDKFQKQQFAIIRAPGSEKSIKRDLPLKPSTTAITHSHRPAPRHGNTTNTYRRGTTRGGRARPATAKAH